MGNAYKREVKDWRGEVIGVDVGRFFPIEAHAAADRAETLLNSINPAGFVSTPFGGKGVPFDDAEEPAWPSDATARDYPPNCDFVSHPPVGEFIAQQGYTAAESDSECSTVGCVIPQVRDNGSA